MFVEISMFVWSIHFFYNSKKDIRIIVISYSENFSSYYYSKSEKRKALKVEIIHTSQSRDVDILGNNYI